MTSDEHSASPEERSTPQETTGPSSGGRRRKPSIQLVVALAFLGLILIAGTVGLIVFDRATAIDRSTPTVVVGQFLVASFDDRDTRRVALFVCEQLEAGQALDETVSGIDPDLSVSWGDFSIDQNGDIATVTGQLRFRLDQAGTSYSSVEQWRFNMVKQDGWRVCGIQRP